MKYGVTDDRMKGLGRSFIKGPRFFVKPSKQNCCEKCVYGSGEHSAGCIRAVPAKKSRKSQSASPAGK